MSLPIYVDFDYTLGYGTYKDSAQEILDRFIFRPGAHEFLEALRPYGNVVILTASVGGWAEAALKTRPDLKALISDIIPGERLDGVRLQLEQIFRLRGLSDREKVELVGLIQPVADGGVIFDDNPFGSDVYFWKSSAAGIFNVPDLWIQVPEFSKTSPDAGGLEQAFLEFKKRNTRWNRKGIMLAGKFRKKGVELSSA